MAMLASTKQGALGSGTSRLRVFQDFFTEMGPAGDPHPR
jgi:hypothetical protein